MGAVPVVEELLGLLDLVATVGVCRPVRLGRSDLGETLAFQPKILDFF
jgi:hypothetical protein